MLRRIGGLAVAAFLAVPAFAAPHGTVVNRPVRTVGDSCSYKVIDDWKGTVKTRYTATVSGITSSGIQVTVTTASGKTEHLGATLDGNLRSWNGTTFSPDSGFYAFPMYVGKSWKVHAKFARPSGYHGSYDLTATVVGTQEIKVAGTEFSTLEIRYIGSYEATNAEGYHGGNTEKMTRWYIPTLGCTAKTDYQDRSWNGNLYNWTTTGLVAYHRVKPGHQ